MAFRYGTARYGEAKYGPGTELDTWQLQLELDGAGGGWTDVADDVREEAVVCDYGIDGSDPADRVARTGQLTCALDNSEYNSGSTLGYYAPFHADRRSGFGYDIGARLVFRFRGVNYYKFRGQLSDIAVAPGRYGSRLTRIQAVDYMDDLARTPVPDLAAQTGKRADEIIAIILAAISAQPAAQDLEPGVDTFTWALDGGTGQQNTVREELQKLCLSEQGYAYLRGDTTQGGTFAFEARGHRSLDTVTELSFDNDMVGCTVAGSRDDVYGLVRVIVHPTRVDASATTVLFSLEDTATLVAAGTTVDTIFGPYRDPATNDPCGGTAMVAPVATTDYLMNSAQDGGGSNLTANFTVTASYTGQGVRYTITNNGGTDGYVTFLQARGKGIYRSTTVVEEVVSGSGDRVLELDLPYQTSVNAANNIALQLATALSTPRARVQSVTFLAQHSEAFLEAAMALEPGDRIAITEDATGLSGDLFTINSVRLELRPSGHLWCTWGLRPWGLDPWWTTPTFSATGGTITDISGFRVHTFTSSGTFTVSGGETPTTVDVLLVGGGGPGGDDLGGGGGGGGVRQGTASVTTGAYAVVVGAGGTTSTGSPSTAFGLTAHGGGTGGNNGEAGGAGGSGGGGGADSASGGAGTTDEGYAGGRGGPEDEAGGGGGGAGARGGNGSFPGQGGNGGAGRSSSITGTLTYYGGGGGGDGYSDPGGGGLGGGGDAGSAGTANTGGGGGASSSGGKAGGSGIVIVRYPIGT